MKQKPFSTAEAELVRTLGPAYTIPTVRIIDSPGGLASRHFPNIHPDRVLTLNPETALRGFSADVLLLDSADTMQGMRFADVRLIGIAVPSRRSIYRAIRGIPEKFTPVRILDTDAGSLLLSYRAKRLRPSARVFLDPRVGVEGLGTFLRVNRLRVVCLRWFDGLPELAPGEDLDLLVHGDDLEEVRGWLRSRPGTVPIDLYSHDGRSPGNFGLTPYFSQRLATEVLASAQLHPTGLGIPSPAAHFRSLAFHAALHKGDGSGLNRDDSTPRSVTAVNHDYEAALRDSGELAGFDLPPSPITLDWLWRWIDEHGDRPSWESLSILARSNPWLRERLREMSNRLRPTDFPGSWTAYLIRERTLEVMTLDDVVEVLAPERSRLHAFFSHRLSAAESVRLASFARGGNWGRGPFKSSGGVPAHLVLVWDARWSRGSVHDSGSAIVVENPRFQARKEKLRRVVGRLPVPAFNPCHSADSWLIAEEWINQLDPASSEAARRACSLLRQAVTHFPCGDTHHVIGRSTRAHCYRTSLHGEVAVVKAFYPWAQEAFERELSAASSLAAAGISPRVIESGNRWIASEFHLQSDSVFHEPFGQADYDEICRTIEAAMQAGWRLLDAHSNNFIRDSRTGKLLVVDLEDAVPATEADVPALRYSDSVGRFRLPTTLAEDVGSGTSRLKAWVQRMKATDSRSGSRLDPMRRLLKARDWLSGIYRSSPLPDLRRRLLLLRTVRYLKNHATSVD